MEFENIKEGMYFRCPIDQESVTDPRDFAMGQVEEIIEAMGVVTIEFKDPFGYRKFYTSVPTSSFFRAGCIERCKFQNHINVKYDGHTCEVLESVKTTDGYYSYYLKRLSDMKVIMAHEAKIDAPFNGERIFPANQLANYEFQNPCWLGGQSIVKSTMNILENSMYGFKDLAGCRIFLKAYQMQTIMRCVQSDCIRYMIADEVGLGKTIEASSVLKIFMKDRCDQNILLIVPETLKHQWKTELLMKFSIVNGENENRNHVTVTTFNNFMYYDAQKKWDFIIVDEVHKVLKSEKLYRKMHQISQNAEHVLLLSATPVQERKGEYLNLLRLLEPSRYDTMDVDEFNELIGKQILISERVVDIYDNFIDFDQLISELEEGEQLSEDELEDAQYNFEDIQDSIDELMEILDDPKIEEITDGLEFDIEGKWLHKVKVLIAYISEYYQIDKNVIRNRRNQLEDEFAERFHDEIPYEYNTNITFYEMQAYRALATFLEEIKEDVDVEVLKQLNTKLLQAFFSSPWAYKAMIERVSDEVEPTKELMETCDEWCDFENGICDSIVDALDDPDRYDSRMLRIINYLEEKWFEKKVVLFTNYTETLKQYFEVFEEYYLDNEVVQFSKENNTIEENEKAIYLFQQDPDCHILICDASGAEGRNLQGADAIVHIDLPWKADEIEQRIGRLDRFGRDIYRPVISAIPYAIDTIEEDVFNFFNDGLKVFDQPLSGLEIVIDEINQKIETALVEDSVYGLANIMPELKKSAQKMKESVQLEQIYDASAYKYKPLNIELNELIESYTAHENELFTKAMLAWASLAGFVGYRDRARQLTCFTEKSFSVNSAKNTMLIPPDWEAYEQKEEYKKRISIQRLFETSEERKKYGPNILKGTFNRDQAIKNDYLHFFAPGDEIFDCIVENAMNSSKGQSAAVAVQSDINWKGIIYTWSVQADERILLEEGVSLHALSQFRNYLTSDQAVIAIPLVGYEDVPIEDVLARYNVQVIHGDYKKLEHLGRRGKTNTFLNIGRLYNESNMNFFKYTYNDETWNDIVQTSMKASLKLARNELFMKSQLKLAQEEKDQIVSSTEAAMKYYNQTNIDVEKMSKDLELVYKSISSPRMVLDTACYLWLVNE